MKSVLLFWMWNDELDPAEIRRQIGEFHRKGVEGFFIHPMPSEFRPDDFPGGMPGYLSEHFFAMVRVAVECAAELGMEAWLYDEGGWPSGILNGRLVAEHPELRMRHILPDGTLEVAPSRADLLNPETTAIFLRETHDKYAACLSEYLGTVVPGIFTDEPFFGKFRPGMTLPWSPGLAARFQKETGIDAREAAMRIHRGGESQLRREYCRAWVAQILDGYLLPIREWCHAHNMLSIGHFNGDDCVKNVQELLGGDFFAVQSGFDVCGCDAIWRQIHPLAPETDFSRLTSSAAQGRPTLSETFAVYGEDLSLAEMKQVAAMQFAAGIERIAPMAAHYSDRGGRQVTTVSNFFGADPRWGRYAHFSGFCRRMSGLFRRTAPLIKASVPFPRTGLQTGAYEGELFPDGLKLAVRQITFDYVPDAPEPPANIPSDVRLAAPCPALRTRHLKSPRGERLLLVNSGLDPIRFRFSAPKGFSVWYDPADGSRTPARPDADGMLSLELPFAGVMILLTVPGKPWSAAPAPAASERRPVAFRASGAVRMYQATPNGLVELPPPATLPERFCGTRRYEAQVDVPAAREATLVLPSALRAMIEFYANGELVGSKVWAPYSWKFTLRPGVNRLTLDVTGTPAAAMTSPEHVRYLEEHGFLNSYARTCAKFPALFPDEAPLDGAYLGL